MNTHLKIYETRDELVLERDTIVRELRSKSKDPENEVKYGDDFISAPGAYYKLRTFKFEFPLADFAGYTTVNLGKMLDKLRMIVSELEKYSGMPAEPAVNTPKTPVKTDENEALEGEQGKDTPDESNNA